MNRALVLFALTMAAATLHDMGRVWELRAMVFCLVLYAGCTMILDRRDAAFRRKVASLNSSAPPPEGTP